MSSRSDCIDQVIQDYLTRRLAGDEVPDDSLIALHPDLMPELGEQLHRLRLLRQAEQAADATQSIVDSANCQKRDTSLVGQTTLDLDSEVIGASPLNELPISTV